MYIPVLMYLFLCVSVLCLVFLCVIPVLCLWALLPELKLMMMMMMILLLFRYAKIEHVNARMYLSKK